MHSGRLRPNVRRSHERDSQGRVLEKGTGRTWSHRIDQGVQGRDPSEGGGRLETRPGAVCECRDLGRGGCRRANLAEEIARLKRQPGKEILAHGGAGFARSLVQLGLVDEYRLLVHPVALGRGLSLFSGLSEPVSSRLSSVT
ncbi:MAG TPA: dihydrofolate reductase family protein, partial [Microvirga sp.]|nr:dihydrofolate reductase family protein [Microvirga sp.]